jgi:hypothetical protein
MLLIDVIEHVEDYYTFLRNLRPKATYKLLHIPLEITAVNLLRKKTLLKIRETYDIQYFTKDLALAALEDAGYEVLDYMYTPRNLELAPSFKRKLMIPPRKLAFALNQDFACRVLGGFSLLVLAK